MTKKQSTFKFLITGLIVLAILLLTGFFFFSKGKEKENQTKFLNAENNHCSSNCKKEFSTNDNFCQHCGERLKNFRNIDKKKSSTKKRNQVQSCSIKIQKTTSGKYFVNWLFNKFEGNNHSFFEEGKGCYSAEKMPEILAEYQEC